MLTVLALMALVGGLGHLARLPARYLVLVIAAIWAAVLLVQLALPEGSALRQATGGRAQPWLLLGMVAALILGYWTALGALRRRARPVAVAAPAAANPAGPFSPEELDRYSRHILLHEIGGPGQRRLKQARVLVVGAGGLGSPALLYLAAAGVGTLGVVDDDRVDASNLQRQVIHRTDSLGQPKVASAVATLAALNPHVTLQPHALRLDAETAAPLFADYDLILDGSDNFDTRYLVNEVAARLGKPLIAAAITQWEGQISLYDPARGAPCYACVFPDRPAPGMVPTCAQAGVAAPLPGIIGAMMASEAVKHVTRAGETLRGRLLVFDALHAEARVIRTRRDPACRICGALYPPEPA